MIVEGSNIPMMPNTEAEISKKGALIIPDFIANAGGVISSYVEYIGGTEKEMFRMVEDKIKKNVAHVLTQAEARKILPREAALVIAKERVLEKCATCRI